MYYVNRKQHETMSLEEIVDVYVQKARAKTRLTEYSRRELNGLTLHHITENDQFRLLDHLIAVQDNRVAWVWRSQDFWPTDVLTDVTVADRDLCNFGIIHGGERIAGSSSRWGREPEPDRIQIIACPSSVISFISKRIIESIKVS